MHKPMHKTMHKPVSSITHSSFQSECVKRKDSSKTFSNFGISENGKSSKKIAMISTEPP